jgi:cobalt/nickel transport system ATP-binding protein
MVTPLFDVAGLCVDRAGRRILDGLDLRLDPGERLAVAGANGAGKSTLLRALVGLERVAGGRITAFGDERRREADFHAVRLRAGFLFQDADDQLFAPTVVEDVAFGPLNRGLTPAAAEAAAMAALASLGLEALAPRFTHRLSGGEKRLAALAGVLAMDPDALLLDEPTNALDAHHRDRLIGVLAGLAAERGTAMILVSHDTDFLDRLATRVAVLADGRLGAATLHRHAHRHDHVHIHPH